MKAIRLAGSPSALAKLLDVPVQNVTNWRVRGIPPKEYRKVSGVLGITVDQLLDPSPDVPPQSKEGETDSAWRPEEIPAEVLIDGLLAALRRIGEKDRKMVAAGLRELALDPDEGTERVKQAICSLLEPAQPIEPNPQLGESSA